MDEFLDPIHPVGCIIEGPTECGKPFITNLILNVNGLEKIYIYSSSLHQDFYQKSIKCFNDFIPTNVIQNILNEENLDPSIEEIVIDENFEKSAPEIETFESIEELKTSRL